MNDITKHLPKGVELQMVVDAMRGMATSDGLTTFQQVNARIAGNILADLCSVPNASTITSDERAELERLRAAKWDVQHTDTMNDFALLGIDRDHWKERAEKAEAALSTLSVHPSERAEPPEYVTAEQVRTLAQSTLLSTFLSEKPGEKSSQRIENIDATLPEMPTRGTEQDIVAAAEAIFRAGLKQVYLPDGKGEVQVTISRPLWHDFLDAMLARSVPPQRTEPEQTL